MSIGNLEYDLFRAFTISELSSQIESGNIDRLTLYRCSELRYENLDQRLHAFKFVYTLAEADSMLRGASLPAFQPLRDIPFGIKDVFNTTVGPTGMGSSIWDSFEAGNNARCVDALIRSGAVPFGKTITAEFAVHALNETRNLYDYARTPGTSSSGSAVAVAAGIVPFAIGTQTAASIIRPASFCGIWGMKPSFGLIPRTGSLKTTDSLDTIGFFTFFGSDLRRILSSIRVKGPNYPYVYSNLDKRGPFPKPSSSLWKIGFFKSAFWNSSQSEIKEAVETFVSSLKNDPKIELSIIPDHYGTEVHEAHQIIYDKSLSYYFQQESLMENQISSLMAEAIERGRKITPSEYSSALGRQSAMIEESKHLFSDIDIIVSISTSTTAPLRDQSELPDPSLIWTFLGMPSINVPIGLSSDGLPIGLQLSANKYDDYLLLQFIDYALSLRHLENASLKMLLEL